jgi:hypothetical protein
MSTYCICSLGDGIGFKVQVADPAGGLRIVGVSTDEDIAKAWITADQQAAEPHPADGRCPMPHGR